MKPVIGIVCRGYKSVSNRKLNIVYNDIIFSVVKSGGVPICIPYSEDISKYLEICKGFIFQGGDDVCKFNLKSLKILRDKNIPTLGICLGMQEMFGSDSLVKVSNHNINTIHEVKIDKLSLLYKILKKEKILVNSRHNFCIKKTKYFVSAMSLDGVIESVEDRGKKFFLGVQWHPENLYSIDSNSRKIFNYFINICNS